jgi:Cof subfamily protein (haloacid dehalogenase superfamily)
LTTAKYRLLVLDIDGTLVGHSGELTDRVRSALRATQERGIHIALCTGRPMASCAPLARDLGLHGPHVVFNGALAKDPESGAVVLERRLPMPVARRVIDFCREHGICCELYTDDTHYVEHDWRESRLHAISIRVTYEFGDFETLLRQGEPVKLQVITADDRARGLVARLAEEMRDEAGISWAIPMPPAVDMECVNIVHPSASKGEAVKALAAHFGLDRSGVMAAGDAPNDLPVFDVVGFRIAMGNADPRLKAVAEYIAPDVNEDGLAVAVEELLLGR